MQETPLNRDRREELMASRLWIDQFRRGRHPGCPVVTQEVRARLARHAGGNGAIAGSAADGGSRNSRVEDKVDEFIDVVLLISFRNRGTGSAEKRITRLARVIEIPTVARHRFRR